MLVVVIVLAICFFRKPKEAVVSEKPDSPVLKSALKNNKKEEPKTKDTYNFSDDEEVTVKTETKQAKKSPAQKQYGFSDDEEQIYL